MMNILENRSYRVSCFHIYMHVSEHYDLTCLILMIMNLYYGHHNDCKLPEYIIQENNQVHWHSFIIFSFLVHFPITLSLLKILSKIKLIMFNCHQSIPCQLSNLISLYPLSQKYFLTSIWHRMRDSNPRPPDFQFRTTQRWPSYLS